MFRNQSKTRVCQRYLLLPSVITLLVACDLPIGTSVFLDDRLYFLATSQNKGTRITYGQEIDTGFDIISGGITNVVVKGRHCFVRQYWDEDSYVHQRTEECMSYVRSHGRIVYWIIDLEKVPAAIDVVVDGRRTINHTEFRRRLDSVMRVAVEGPMQYQEFKREYPCKGGSKGCEVVFGDILDI